MVLSATRPENQIKTSVRAERLYSSAEFEAMAEFEERYELIEGKVVKKAVPGLEHARIARLIVKRYDLFDPEEKIGSLLFDVSTKIGPRDTPLPDLSFWTAARQPARTAGAAPMPDLAVEVLSPRDKASKKRREEVQAKIRRYQVAGVSLIWLIDPALKQIEVYRPGQLDPSQVLAIGDELDGEDLIPGFKITLNDLFN